MPREAGRGNALDQTNVLTALLVSPVFLLVRLSEEDNPVEPSIGWLPSTTPDQGLENDVSRGASSLCGALPVSQQLLLYRGGTCLGSPRVQEASDLYLLSNLSSACFYPRFNVFCPLWQFGACPMEHVGVYQEMQICLNSCFPLALWCPSLHRINVIQPPPTKTEALTAQSFFLAGVGRAVHPT